MKFKTVAEAFNHYRNYTNEQLEKRAGEINQEIETGDNVDIQAFNIELTGIAEAKRNNDIKAEGSEDESRSFKLLGGRDSSPKTFKADTVLDTEEYRSAFFKTMLGQDLNEVEKRAFDVALQVAEKRADEFSTSTNAAAVLPTTTLNEVIAKARTIGGLLGECRTFAVPTKISIPIGTPATKASWHTEGEAVETEKVTVANVTFDGYEIIKIFSISAKARKMSIAAFESYLIDELKNCVMETIADALINGTGSGQGTGLESGVTWVKNGEGQNHIEVAANSDIGYSDIVQAVTLLKRGYSAGAKWAMNNKTLYGSLYTMYDGNGRPLFISDLKDEEIGKVLTFPVVIDDNIADNTIYLGNFKKYLGYNLPEGIVIETSRESSFKKGLIDYRAMAIADTKPLISEAFVKISKAAAN